MPGLKFTSECCILSQILCLKLFQADLCSQQHLSNHSSIFDQCQILMNRRTETRGGMHNATSESTGAAAEQESRDRSAVYQDDSHNRWARVLIHLRIKKTQIHRCKTGNQTSSGSPQHCLDAWDQHSYSAGKFWSSLCKSFVGASFQFDKSPPMG